jgi:pimeloyl-ACP methyl ester carboxylesterase
MAHLVFLHGGLHGSWCWKYVLEELQGTNSIGKILTLDMPGCGTKRSRPTSDETLTSIASELNQDIKDAGLKDVILIGHSIAGVLLPMMAAEDPSLFSKLIYLATNLPLEGESINQTMGTTVHGEDQNRVGFPLNPLTTSQEDLAMAMFGPDLSPEQLGWLMSEVAQDKTPPVLGDEPVSRKGYDGKIPATYVLTLRDPILPPGWQRRFAERALCEKVVEIDTPHEPFVSHPRLLAETLSGIIMDQSG